MDGIDSDHDGRVSLEEFRAYYHDELDNEAMRKNAVRNRGNIPHLPFSGHFQVVNARKRLLRREDSVDGWTKKTEWAETGGQWQQSRYASISISISVSISISISFTELHKKFAATGRTSTLERGPMRILLSTTCLLR